MLRMRPVRVAVCPAITCASPPESIPGDNHANRKGYSSALPGFFCQ